MIHFELILYGLNKGPSCIFVCEYLLFTCVICESLKYLFKQIVEF